MRNATLPAPFGRRLACLLCLLFGAAASAQAYQIEGQVFDLQGQALSGVSVRAVERLEHLTLPGLDRPAEQTVLATTTTGPGGFYRLSFERESLRGRIWVEFGDSGKWDGRRYVRPAPREATLDLRREGQAIVNCLVRDAAGWRELAHEISRNGGPASKRGQILRRLGMPPEKLTRADGRVEWRYSSVTYVFEGDTLVEARRHGAEARADGRRGAS